MNDLAMSSMTPQEIVSELDRHIIGQNDAKRAVAIGSGGAFAQAAAKGLIDHTELSAEEVVRKSLAIAGELCIYTNRNIVVEQL